MDFWVHFDRNNNFFIDWLSTYYTVIVTEKDPEFLFYSGYGFNHLNYSCYRIFYNAENERINWNACDWAFSFEYINNQRHFRLPNWFLYDDCRVLLKPKPNAIDNLKSKTGFCNMVVSNSLPKKRIEFFHKLSEYKRIDSGGRTLNNIGDPVVNKRKFLRDYKFTLAFENSSYPGYTTEKIFEPMIENSIPIYWGNPVVGRDFNCASFVNWHDFNNDDAVIDYIIQLDNDDEKYCKMFNEPWYLDNKLPDCVNEVFIVRRLEYIIRASRKKVPVAKTFHRYLYKGKLQFSRIDGMLNRYIGYRKHFR